ncbi:HNH endonuclease signature motif containing protein [Rheinheimera sp. MM224]|uniref:HNH endonuclease signature motif containing protein n=1 Tax=Rheinheimera sp. MM224 TaxID=3019969 RepID=UPI0021F91067|nr:HNH endonuclease [Rheinheimera sp. MM224]CAI3795819.1 hypothetical protein JAMGFMIE_01413 [Rheinheimera sp. MM224]CAI3795980.1 hypothetical protein JAMGFMIE_01453 [Rheinheimera sp. MM224]
MAKLKMLQPRLSSSAAKVIKTTTTKDNRITGRRLQNRRFNMWKKDPHCALCGRLVDYPSGFELDHKVPLVLGGEDLEQNCQILCCGGKDTCHEQKTKQDLKDAGITKN